MAKQLSLSYQSLDRHVRNCVRKSLEKAAERREVALADRLLDEVEELHRITREVLSDAMVADRPLALKAVEQARRNVELLARLTGKLKGEENAGRGVTLEELELLYVRFRQAQT